jgi:hypothetical protein
MVDEAYRTVGVWFIEVTRYVGNSTVLGRIEDREKRVRRRGTRHAIFKGN